MSKVHLFRFAIRTFQRILTSRINDRLIELSFPRSLLFSVNKLVTNKSADISFEKSSSDDYQYRETGYDFFDEVVNITIFWVIRFTFGRRSRFGTSCCSVRPDRINGYIRFRCKWVDTSLKYKGNAAPRQNASLKGADVWQRVDKPDIVFRRYSNDGNKISRRSTSV